MKFTIKDFFAVGLTIVLASCSQEEPVFNEPNVDPAELDPNLVSLQEAVDMASEHYAGFFGKTRSGKPISLKGFEILRRAQTRADETPESYGYYILNFENDGGFAIVSADRRNEGVYAISDEGSLHLTDTVENGGLNWYLNTYLRMSPINPPVPNDPPFPPDTTKHQIVEPVVEYVNYCTPRLTGFLSKFEQGAPYNKYCLTSSGQQGLVGEFPLNLGSILAYYKRPAPYTYNQVTTNLNWTQMYNDPSDDGWARLFEIVGRPENTNCLYTEEFTFCQQTLITFEEAILTRLGLNSCTYVNTVNIEQLTNEMKAFRPCILVGQSTPNVLSYFIVDGGQHRIITDTHLGGAPIVTYETYFHCVWGWGGRANGYYKLGTVSVGENSGAGLIGPPNPHDEGTEGYIPYKLFKGMYYNIIPL